MKKKRVRERVKYGCDTIPSLKKVEHAKKIRVRRVQHRTVKKNRVRERVKYGCDTIPSLKKVNAQKKTGSAGERTGQIRVGYHTVLKKKCCTPKRIRVRRVQHRTVKKNRVRERVKYGCDTIPSLKKVEHAQKKRVQRVHHRTVKKKRVRERVKYGWGTIPSLKKVLHAKKNTGSAGPAQNREKKNG